MATNIDTDIELQNWRQQKEAIDKRIKGEQELAEQKLKQETEAKERADAERKKKLEEEQRHKAFLEEQAAIKRKRDEKKRINEEKERARKAAEEKRKAAEEKRLLEEKRRRELEELRHEENVKTFFKWVLGLAIFGGIIAVIIAWGKWILAIIFVICLIIGIFSSN